MENNRQATTVEEDHKGFVDLQDQLLSNREGKNSSSEERESPRQSTSKVKKFVLRRGDDSIEVDDDYELEFMADKRLTRLQLKELKDRAAGDIAIKNRMHSLAEEKKRVQSTFREFSELSKKDPLAALEFISRKAQESDSEFEYEKYLEKLADQAEKLGQMDEKERKAWELQKKLDKAQQDLSQKERIEAVALRKQDLLEEYPEIGNSELGQMVEAVLANDELLEGVENEDDFMDKVEDLVAETLTQRDLIQLIQEINPDEVNNNELIFSLSDQLRLHPDFDEEDVRDIISELVSPIERSPVRSSSRERDRDIETLSRKARQATPVSSMRMKNASDYDLLMQRILDGKKINKQP